MKKLIQAGFPVFLLAFFLLLSLAGYVGFAWHADKNEPWWFLLFYALSIAGFAYWWFNRSLLSWPTILIIAIIFRALFLFDPTCRLSGDINRYLWDAELVAHGDNPYRYTPTEWKDSIQTAPNAISDELFNHIAQPNSYSVYPPTCQLMWSNSVWWAEYTGLGNSIANRIFFLKGLTLLLEIITMLLIVRVLFKRGQAGQLAGIYALNPLVIVEFMGNLHPDVVLILLLSISVLLVTAKRIPLAAIPFGFAIATKLMAIIFLPFLVKKWGWKKALIFSLISLGVAFMIYMPLISVEIANNIISAAKFNYIEYDFNASLYYVVRNGLNYVTGVDTSYIVGPGLAILSGIAVVFLASRNYSEGKGMLYYMISGLAVYSLCSTTVHPWHLTLPLFFAIFTNVRWPLFASMFVMLSYLLYTQGMENSWILFAEYGLIYASYTIDRLVKSK